MNPRHSLEELAAIRVHRLPASLRLLLRAVGAMNDSRGGVLSYLLTEEWYMKSLIRRGFRDALVQRSEIADFLEIPLISLRATPRMRAKPRSRVPAPALENAPPVILPESDPRAMPLQA
jgi:hypothetical protein